MLSAISVLLVLDFLRSTLRASVGAGSLLGRTVNQVLLYVLASIETGNVDLAHVGGGFRK